MRTSHPPFFLVALLGASSIAAHAQPSAAILKEPADWRLEKLPVPAPFAPDIKIAGSEEIRFAPGMFDNTSATYFTCVLVITANGAPAVGAPELKDFLEKYYRGLSVGLGRRKGQSPDRAQMNATVTPGSGDDRYTAAVTFFDSFTDGRKITLNVEARVVRHADAGKTYIALLVSPQPKNNAIWGKLREIGSKLDFSAAR